MKKFTAVKNFFEKDLYLLNRANILIRKKIIGELLGKVRETNILDIGCGDGTISLQFARENLITLVDGSSLMIDEAKKIISKNKFNNVTLMKGDFFELEFDNKYDIIFCIGLVSHVDDVELLFKRIETLLRQDGLLVIQFSKIDHFYYSSLRKKAKNQESSYGYELNTYTENEFHELLSDKGYNTYRKKEYSWPKFPISYLPYKIQFHLINLLRKIPLFYFLNSEQVLLLERKERSTANS